MCHCWLKIWRPKTFIIFVVLLLLYFFTYNDGTSASGHEKKKIDEFLKLDTFPILYLDENIAQSRTKRQLESPFSSLDFGDCLSKPSCTDIGNITSRTVGIQNVFYAATRSQIMKVHISDDSSQSCMCTIVHNSTDPVLSIVMDDSRVYWLSADRTAVRYLSIETENSVPSTLSLSQEMLADYRPYLYAACRIPTYVPDIPDPTVVQGSYLAFNLTDINNTQHAWFSSAVCVQETHPNITYAFLYMRLNSSNQSGRIPQSCIGTSDCVFERVDKSSSLSNVRLENLSPNSQYIVYLIIFSQAQNHRSAVISPGSIFGTSCGVPASVRSLKCLGINEREFRVTWEEPEVKNSDEIRYEVYRNNQTTGRDISGGRVSLVYESNPGVPNHFLIKTFSVDCSGSSQKYSISEIADCRVFDLPLPISVFDVADMQATIEWTVPSDQSVQFVIIQWSIRAGRNTQATWSQSEMINGSLSFYYRVTDLIPNSGYDFRAMQQYIGHTGDEGWLYSDIVTAMTDAGVPGYPQQVEVVRGSSNILTWVAPNSNGPDLEYYVIEYRNRSSPNATRIIYNPWVTATNISAKFTQWVLYQLIEELWYEFRVSAVNRVGRGDASAPSAPYYYYFEKDVQEDYTLWIVVGTTGGMVVLLFLIILAVACRRCGKESLTIQSPPSSEITTIHLSYGTDLQLAQIRHMAELARWEGAPNIPQDYMDLLPIFPREKLTITEFLGKGAFGEVYKGIAVDVDGDIGIERKVAVKTLREGSTDSEKCEFLMEAYFMSNFSHRNILSLLGVCLDNEPQYLILELMEGGDLLHYIRDARPNPIMGAKLTTAALLDICLDVAAGCKYLEDQRFIHRDLAARNCLVSTPAFRTDNRVVKIGDFGLARDIYRNDYYHKAGEGLLPVRWMAPESLVDNVYTTQSDIWSFGVLLWEIMTFGQQPYPARTNLEVLQLVRAGGRLEKPDHCPNDIYALMMKCWNGTPSLRPTFGWALQWLQEFKRRNLNLLMDDDFAMDMSNVNYTTVTTSEEDFVENDPPQSSTRSPAHRFTEAVLGFDNVAFDAQENNAARVSEVRYDSDEDQDASSAAFRRRIFPQMLPSQEAHHPVENGSSYLRISTDTGFNRWPSNLATSRSDIGMTEQMQENPVTSSDEALNYSVLGFPPSRNPSTRSNFHTTPKEIAPSSLRMPSVSEARASTTLEDDVLLPYRGDLPITDEERLMRKQHWKRQSQLQRSKSGPRNTLNEEVEGYSRFSSPERVNEFGSSDHLSAYLRGSIPLSAPVTVYNRNRSNNNTYSTQYLDGVTIHINHPREDTNPKVTYIANGTVQEENQTHENASAHHHAMGDHGIVGENSGTRRPGTDDYSELSGSSLSGPELVEELTRHWASDPDISLSSPDLLASDGSDGNVEVSYNDIEEHVENTGMDVKIEQSYV